MRYLGWERDDITGKEREFYYSEEGNVMTQLQWDASSPLAKLLASRKFLLMVMDVVISLALYFGGKYADPSAVEDLKVVIGLLQPVWVTLIYSIAKEDAAQAEAESLKRAQEKYQPGLSATVDTYPVGTVIPKK